MPAPEFSNTFRFPSFKDCPSADEISVKQSDGNWPHSEWYLLAQIKDIMTINHPTLILTDRSGADFALVWDRLPRNGLDLVRSGLKRGATAVICRASRTVQGEGKQGFVKVGDGKGEGVVSAIPGPLERVLEVGAEIGRVGRRCERCGGGAKESRTLMKCRGCKEVEYCTKECQAAGWSDGGHRTDCKIFRAIKEIWVP